MKYIHEIAPIHSIKRKYRNFTGVIISSPSYQDTAVSIVKCGISHNEKGFSHRYAKIISYYLDGRSISHKRVEVSMTDLIKQLKETHDEYQE